MNENLFEHRKAYSQILGHDMDLFEHTRKAYSQIHGHVRGKIGYAQIP